MSGMDLPLKVVREQIASAIDLIIQQSRLKGGGLARAAAILVAATLTGAPRVLALNAPLETHRCSCRAHSGSHQECDCALCRRATLSAQARDGTVPPCHRAAARKELSRGEQAGSHGAPCVEGRCGFPERPVTVVGGVEPFFSTSTRLAAAMGRDEPLLDRREVVLRRAAEPETPPPRVG